MELLGASLAAVELSSHAASLWELMETELSAGGEAARSLVRVPGGWVPEDGCQLRGRRAVGRSALPSSLSKNKLSFSEC